MPEILRRYVDLSKDDIAWYESTYPRGSLTGILSILLTKFREVHEKTPADYAKLAAEALKGEKDA